MMIVPLQIRNCINKINEKVDNIINKKMLILSYILQNVNNL
jgi:hypothetical protein